MCGIFGKLYFKSHRREKKVLLDCLDTLSHRGPDDTGYHEDGDMFLGSRRLSIIDLSKDGRMPMSNKDGSLWIIFNGEIYNYLELRREFLNEYRFKSHTDTEVVLHLYEKFGPSCLGKLRGMFAFAIWNPKKGELFLARDQLGKKPIKYYVDESSFVFASELKAILKDPSVPREIDPVAIDHFLTYQYVPSPRTGFKHIYKLEPGHYLLIDRKGAVTKKRYWKPHYEPKTSLRGKDLEKELLNKLKESVRLRLRSDVAVGAHLSGGIDSSLVVALASVERNKPIKTFSVGFRKIEYDELPFARLVAQRYKTDHHEIVANPAMLNDLSDMVYHFEEPYGDPSMLPTWLLCRETKKEVTVVLNGDGGDENFAGYLRYKAFKIYTYIRPLPFKKQMEALFVFFHNHAQLRITRHAATLLHYINTSADETEFYAKLVGYLDNGKKNGIYTDDFRRQVRDSHTYDYLHSRMGAGKSLEKLLSLDVQTYLGEDLLTKVDIAGMAHSLEIRSPFLDQEFMEFAARIPFAEKLKGFEGKYILKKIARPYLPPQCIDREKKGFAAPIKEWLQGELKSEVDKLASGKIVSCGIVKKDRLRASIKSGWLNHNEIWTLIMLNKWLEIWFPT